MRRALPALALSAAGLTWLLRVQGVIDTGPQASSLVTGADSAATAGRNGGGAPVPGPVVPTQYGPVQVAAVIRSGHLDDVQTLKVPDVDANSKRLTAQAVPILRQAAITAQNARIDTVAGATFTSVGYRNSLQGALDSARFGPRGGGDELASGTTSTTDTTLAPGATTTIPGAWPTPPTGGPAPTFPPAPATTAKPGGAVTAKPGGQPVATPAPTVRQVVPAGPKTGVGNAVFNSYGNVQVTVTVTGSKVTGCIATGPSDAVSKPINDNALPILCGRVVSAGTSNVAAVSGATRTTEAFRQSAKDALQKAGLGG